MKYSLTIFTLFLVLLSCKQDKNTNKASGIFESDEVIVAAEVSGRILSSAEEGEEFKAGDTLIIIDDVPLQLQKNQLMASLSSLSSKTNKSKPQKDLIQQQKKSFEQNIVVQREQLKVLDKERSRINNLVSKDAIPKKQLDDIDGQIAVLKQQIEASVISLKNYDQQIKTQDENVTIFNTGVLSEREPIQAKIAQIEDQIKRCIVKAPIDGTVLTAYMNAGEITTPGKPILKLASHRQIFLRTYLTATQLAEIKLNQSAEVAIGNEEGRKKYNGTIVWISDKAEFTPKTIQTADERENLVYAVKIKVNNDGMIKLGMYGDVILKQ